MVQNRCMKTRTTPAILLNRSSIYMLLFLFFLSMTGSAQTSKFPAWMDEVDFSAPAPGEKAGFNSPQGPVDPSTGQATTIESSKSSVFNKPKLPDFSKLREKAIKSELEKKASDSNQLEQSYSVSLKNLEQLQTSKQKLDTLLAANPGEDERHQLLKAIGEIERKLNLSNELVKLMGSDGVVPDLAKAVASLTPEQYQKALQLSKQLFQNSGTGGEITPPKSLFPEFKAPAKADKNGNDGDDEEYEPRPRTYRPGQIKPFYQELKKAQQRLKEENSDE